MKSSAGARPSSTAPEPPTASRGRWARARAWMAGGLWPRGAEEIARLLASSPPEAPGTLVGTVQALLGRRGWRLSSRTLRGRARFLVRRAGAGRALFELALEPRDGTAFGTAASLVPMFRLRFSLGPGLRPEEQADCKEFSAALGLLLEWLRGRTEAGAGPAAAERHEGRRGNELLLRTTFVCNQRCPFCFVPLTPRPDDPARIERVLEDLPRPPGPREILTLSGGEPTADPNLLRIIRFARRKGFRRFGLQTNGVLLARAGLLERLVRLGVVDYMISFHSHKPELYDRLTGSRGHFPDAVAGLRKLIRTRPCRVTVNVVVNAHNHQDLPALIGFLGRLCADIPRRRRPGVYFSMINEIGHLQAPSWTVDLERVAPHLRQAVARCQREGLPVQPFTGESSFPLCLLSRPSRYASARDLPQDRLRYAEDFSGEAGAVGRAKRPLCRRCAYDLKCAGVPAAYARRFGLGAPKRI